VRWELFIKTENDTELWFHKHFWFLSHCDPLWALSRLWALL
jgi:hypothetical protein